MGFVRYVMPGFALAKKAAQVFEQDPTVEGLILDKHGIFTFGAQRARGLRAHDRDGHACRAAAAEEPQSLRHRHAAGAAGAARRGGADRARGLFVARRHGEGAYQRPIMDFRTGDAILNYVNGKDIARYARAGVITPDHVLRVKPWPLILSRAASRQARRFQTGRARGGAAIRGGLPRVFCPQHGARQWRRPCTIRRRGWRWCRGSACSAWAVSAKDAAIAADIAEAGIEGVTDAESIGRFTSIGEADTFDMDYWPLELAKLGAAKSCRWPGKSRRSPAPAAPSARPARARSPRPARPSRCSIAT